MSLYVYEIRLCLWQVVVFSLIRWIASHGRHQVLLAELKESASEAEGGESEISELIADLVPMAEVHTGRCAGRDGGSSAEQQSKKVEPAKTIDDSDLDVAGAVANDGGFSVAKEFLDELKAPAGISATPEIYKPVAPGPAIVNTSN